MRRTAVLIMMAVLAVPAIAASQELVPAVKRAMLFPGSLNVSIGTLAPTERNNVLTTVRAEQGVTAWRKGSMFVVGFVDATKRHDSAGLSWNRTAPTTAGVKLMSTTGNGVVQVVAGVTAQTVNQRSARVTRALYATYWNGWSGSFASTHSRVLPDAFPGQMYASSGYVSAAEPDNWVSSAAIQQGTTVIRRYGVAVIPYIGAAVTADTAGYNWNNRSDLEGGVKVARTLPGGGVIEMAVAKRSQFNRITHESHTRPIVSMNYWMGWAPRHMSR